METVIAKNTDDLARKMADWIVDHIRDTLQRQGRFTIALSGGNTPRRVYQLLAAAPYREQVAWDKIHFFWGDERFVPFDDRRNNAKMAFDTLLDHVPVLKTQVHPMRTDSSPEESAVEYEKILHGYFDRQPFTFDLVLLGLGDDAHTLSLFPGYEHIHEKEKWVTSFYLAEQQMHRVTLTAPVINRAASVVFLVSGADKAVPVSQVLFGKHDPDLYPAQLVQPYRGKTYWFIDEAAAAELDTVND